MFEALHAGHVAYEVRGDGRPILLLHGWPLDRRSMIGPMEPLFAQREGWQRIYVDLPGMGETGAVEGVTTHDDVLDLLEEFIGRVIDPRSFCVAGLSYGGYIAQALVHRLSEVIDGLLLLMPGMGQPVDRRDVPHLRVLRQEKIDYAGVSTTDRADFEQTAVVRTQRHLDCWKSELLPGFHTADNAFLSRLDPSGSFSFDVARLPRPFDKPTLFLLGRQDSSCGYRDPWRALEEYPRASYVVLDRAGHCLNYEQPSLFAALVHDWLDRVEEDAIDGAERDSPAES